MNRDSLLARMIPAMSLATGYDAVGSFTPENAPTRNFDMNGTTIRPIPAGATSPPWPSSRNNPNWRHSDLREVAYVYVRGFYKKMVELGALDQTNP